MAFPSVEQLRNASRRGCGGGSWAGRGFWKHLERKKSAHWFIGIDRQSYQPPQIYDGHFCAAARAGKNNRADCSFILGSLLFKLPAAPTKGTAIDITPPGSRKKKIYWNLRCLAQLWLSQWKIDEALQVDTKLSVLFINVLWLDPLAALCKLIAV